MEEATAATKEGDRPALGYMVFTYGPISILYSSSYFALGRRRRRLLFAELLHFFCSFSFLLLLLFLPDVRLYIIGFLYTAALLGSAEASITSVLFVGIPPAFSLGLPYGNMPLYKKKEFIWNGS